MIGNTQYSEKVMEHFRNPRNVGEIPDASGVGNVGNPVCVIPDTLIHKNCAVAQIKDVAVGESVLAHDGRYHRINRLFFRPYRGPIQNIRVHSLGKVSLTPEHHILSMKMSTLSHKFSAYKKILPDWHLARELKRGDVILYPLAKDTRDREYMPLGIEKSKWDFKSKRLPLRVNVDRDFMRLIGYYLSEGYARTAPCKGTLGFVFSAKETEYIEDVKALVFEKFGLAPCMSRNSAGTAADVKFYSAPLVRFFVSEFGKRAEGKRLPHWAMVLPREKQEGLLCGIWRGDGSIKAKGAKFVTISQELAHQVKTLLLRFKIACSFLVVEEHGIHKKSFCIYVREKRSLAVLASIVGMKIEMAGRKKAPHKSWFNDDYYYTTVWSNKPSIYRGVVYNLDVDEAHSYVSDSATLHNCGDIMKLYIKVDANEVITDAKFKTFGCGAAIATSSMVTELVKGKTVKEALKISNNAVAEALGGLPPIKMHCSLLAEQALKSAIDDYLARSKKR